MTTVLFRSESGAIERAPHWVKHVGDTEGALLARALSPVLDIGCGPGRHVVELARRGMVVLGIDVSLPALELARRRQALVLHRSVFDDIPGFGRWASALLLDGNLGIGGCPATLLRRVAALLTGDGRVLVEAEAPGTRSISERARVEVDGVPGPWFRWTRVGMDALPGLASAAGFVICDEWTVDGRWFAELHRRPR